MRRALRAAATLSASLWAASLGLWCGSSQVAHAAPPVADAKPAPSAVLLPTRYQGEEDDDARRARLDALLADAAQDLGWVLDVSGAPRGPVGEAQLRRLAKERRRLVVLPTLRKRPEGEKPRYELRMTAASPDERALRARVEEIELDDLSVKAVAMLRDVVRKPSPAPTRRDRLSSPRSAVATPPHSAGRAILATNGTLYGGFLGYSLQRSSGSDDPRLLYPLLAVGAGAGLGAAIIVADEWDVGVGNAWYLSAGAWWPAVAGHLIYGGRFGRGPTADDDEPWTYGLVSSATGVTLATVGLVVRDVQAGGAVLAHSGGGMGLLIGGLVEFAAVGNVDEIPLEGMGYGAALGWMAGASTAIAIEPDPVDVLMLDLGAVLGGLAGAAAGSPLLFDEPSPGKTRGWVGAAGGGVVAGTVVAALLLPDDAPPTSPETARLLRLALPKPGVLGMSRFRGLQAPIVGATVQGTW